MQADVIVGAAVLVELAQQVLEALDIALFDTVREHCNASQVNKTHKQRLTYR